jgi:poly-gamma-glutamate synthesis protein (capsule biosynthesis protein)
MLGRSVMQKYVELNNYNYPFEKVNDKLKNADLVFVNLENPVIENCAPHIGGFKFCSPPESIDGLLFAGIDVVTLANNHTENYGQEGIEETKNFLTNRGISVTGLSELVILERGETLFGFLGFDKAQQTLPKLSAEEAKLIDESNSKVDILVVGMHWGVEYQDRALQGVRSLAQDIVKRGADVVVGHHLTGYKIMKLSMVNPFTILWVILFLTKCGVKRPKKALL